MYVGIRAPDGSRLLYEDYERSSTIRLREPQGVDVPVAADLHDGAVQRLAGVSISLAASARSTSPQDGNLAIATAAAETRDVIRELRTLLVDIYPPTLQRSGLQPALADLVAPLAKAGVQVNLDLPEAPQLSEGTVALLYRVAQEAVRNVRTHSHATEVDVQLQVRDDTVHLMIRDNGRGFTPTGDGARDGRGHFGLRLIHDLVAHAGGQVSVTAAPGVGTRLEVTVSQS